MTAVETFGIPELSEEQAQRLLQAASIIADGDTELEASILKGSKKTLTTLLQKSDGSEEAIELAVDKAEGQMPELAFGVTDDALDDALDILAQEEEGTNEVDSEFESLDALEEEEMSHNKLSYEEFQEEWN